MAHDLRFYKDAGTWYDTLNKNTEKAFPADPPTKGLEVLTGKVVKYLLTYYGTDPLNPSYGGRALQFTVIPRNYAPQIRMQLLDDIKRCVAFIKSTETKYTECKLGNIELVDFTYSGDKSNTQIHVHIRVTDIEGNAAPVFLDK